MKRAKTYWLVGVIVVLAGVVLWPLSHCMETSRYTDAQDRDFDSQAVSLDLNADLRLMWLTEPMRSDPGGEASTLAAIMAASSVFNTVSLIGKTGAEAQALLGSPTRIRSLTRAPDHQACAS